MTEQLWSNEAIVNRALQHAGNGIQPHIAWERTAREMRDEYEQRIASMSREISRLDKIIAHLEGSDE